MSIEERVERRAEDDQATPPGGRTIQQGPLAAWASRVFFALLLGLLAFLAFLLWLGWMFKDFD